MRLLLLALLMTSSVVVQAQQLRTRYLNLGESMTVFDHETGRDMNIVCGLRQAPPHRPGHPSPRPPHQNLNQYYLSFGDQELFNFALANQLGACGAYRGTPGAYCSIYVTWQGQGYPQGTGCTHNSFSRYRLGDFQNAVMTLRDMLRLNICF